jgi:hypothetical protein
LDESYQTYLNRVARMTLPDTYRSQVQYIQESPKFQRQATGSRVAIPFPGYTVMTTPWSDVPKETSEAEVYQDLQTCQDLLLQRLDPDLFVPVPASSFHVTLADLIWNGAYKAAIASQPDFEIKLQQAIANIFQQHRTKTYDQPPSRLQVLGVAIMPRALAVCLAPTDEVSYLRITEFRRAIYQSPELIALGIEQQYGFTAHITLGYFGHVAAEPDADHLGEILMAINDRWMEAPQVMTIQQAELRKFDDMTRYYREADWPSLPF